MIKVNDEIVNTGIEKYWSEFIKDMGERGPEYDMKTLKNFYSLAFVDGARWYNQLDDENEQTRNI